MKTNLFILFLAILASVGTIFAENVQIGDLYYDLNAKNRTAEVSMSCADNLWIYEDPTVHPSDNYVGIENAIIPTSVIHNGVEYIVTSIGDYTFYYTTLKSVIIPNSVTHIGDHAFDYCPFLASIEIPNSVTSIGNSVFENCSGLISIEIPNSVTSIGNSAFSGCKGLTSVTIPNSVTSIGDRAFSGCKSLTTVTIPNSVTSIGGGVFRDCSQLPVENNLRYAGAYLVEAVDKSKSVYVIKEGTRWIGNSAFSGCAHLASIEIPNSVTSIGYSAFKNCDNLPVENNLRYAGTYLVEAKDKDQSIYVIKEGTKWIGTEAFSGCQCLEELYIPNSVFSIGQSAFRNCEKLKYVTLPNSVTSIGNFAFEGCTRLNSPVYNSHVFAFMPTTYSGAYVIPDGVESISSYAFYFCTGLTSVTIPNSVTSIEDGTFYCCSGLTSVTIPNSVTGIGNSAFLGCKGLTSVTIPNSVTSIGKEAFEGCSSLTSVTIPNSVTSIGEGAFEGCSSLTSIIVAEGNPFYDSRNECNAIITSASNRLSSGCQTTVIPNSVTYIGSYALLRCQNLISIEIPNSVTSIGNSAFSGCKGLTSVTIPNSVTSIGDGAFSGCKGLTSIEISNRITSIKEAVFSDCTGLTSVIIPNSVTSIDFQAFSGCTSLTSMTIGNNVTRIGDNVFDGCSSLTFIEIPGSVTLIGSGAFRDCKALTSVTCFAPTPPSLGGTVWPNVNCKAIPLYVLEGQTVYFAYKTADQWKDFGSILPISADEREVTTTIVEPNEYSVNISWQKVNGGYTYELTIYDSNGNIVCVLIFDAEGRLLSISYNVPSRDDVPQEAQEAGFSFTVTGLSRGTEYTYSLITKNESGDSIKTESGSFATTDEPQSIENTNDLLPTTNKFLQNNQILILRGDKVYTLQGQEVR